MEILVFITAAVALAAFTYLTGWWGRLNALIASSVVRCGVWVLHEDGGRAALSREIPLRDIYPDALETEDGWLWVGVQMLKTPTHGYGKEEWKRSGSALNRCLTNLSSETRLQTITLIDDDVEPYAQVHERNAAQSHDESYAFVERERARRLREASRSSCVRSVRTWVLIGKRGKPLAQKRSGGGREEETNVKGLISSFWKKLIGIASSSMWAELSAGEVRRVYSDLRLERERFCEQFKKAGGAAQPCTMRFAWQQLWERLNPGEAELTREAPRYDWRTNPRALLCQSSIRLRDWMLDFGDSFYGSTISLISLPAAVYPGLLESLTDSIDFPAVISSHIYVPDQITKDEDLKGREEYAKESIAQGDDELETQYEELQFMRGKKRQGRETILEFGFGVSFGAKTPSQLRARKARLRNLLRACEGMEGNTESSIPLSQHLATMPGCTGLDRRKFEVSSKTAAALMCWTGDPVGVPLDRAQAVLRLMNGSLMGWHFDSRLIANSPSEVIMGEMGSGKSGYLNWKRSCLLALGYQLISFDFNGSATRICLAAGGTIIRPGDATQSVNLGVYPRKPEREEFSDDELTDCGLPKEWLAGLVSMLARLAVDKALGERALPKHLTEIIQKACVCIYTNEDQPGHDELLFALDHWPDHAEKTEARTLANRLRIYKSEGAYGRFLNDHSRPVSISSPHIVFDFQGLLEDPIAAEIAAMAASTKVAQLTRLNRKLKKSFDGDELHILTDVPGVDWVFDHTARAARKDGLNTTAATQSPIDLARPEFEGLRTSAATRFFFRLSAPEQAARVFDLPAGVADLVARLEVGDQSFRPCVLQTPKFVAHLRWEHGPLDQRLLLGASVNDLVTMEQALEGIDVNKMPERLRQALEADALGQTNAVNTRDQHAARAA